MGWCHIDCFCVVGHCMLCFYWMQSCVFLCIKDSRPEKHINLILDLSLFWYIVWVCFIYFYHFYVWNIIFVNLIDCLCMFCLFFLPFLSVNIFNVENYFCYFLSVNIFSENYFCVNLIDCLGAYHFKNHKFNNQFLAKKILWILNWMEKVTQHLKIIQKINQRATENHLIFISLIYFYLAFFWQKINSKTPKTNHENHFIFQELLIFMFFYNPLSTNYCYSFS